MLFVALTVIAVSVAFGPHLRVLVMGELRTLLTEDSAPPVVSQSDFVAIVHATLEQEQFEGLPLSPEDSIADGGLHRRRPVLVSDQALVICPGRSLDASAGDCRASLFDGDLMRPGADFRIPRALRLQLGAANRESAKVSAIDGPFARFTAESDIDAAFEGDDSPAWSAFYRTYPQTAGFVRTSVPVLSEDGTWAAVVLEHHCGGLCGARTVYLLMRDPAGTWRVLVKDLMSIS